MADWSPDLYLKFSDERNRPALDLLSRVSVRHASVVYDLGCGPGNSTALLLQQFPQAVVTGVDNSPAMLAAARLAAPSANYIEADLASWQPPRQADVLFANAALQWVDGHLAVMQRLMLHLSPGGMLAVQMPDNLNEPSHALMRKVAGDRRWQGRLRAASEQRQPILTPQAYADALSARSSSLEVWRTTYCHRLAGHAAIVEFVSSTGLRPFLAPLQEAEREQFKRAYERELAAAYPTLNDGSVLLPFPRIFLVARL